MHKDTKNDNKEKTLSLKTGTKSSKSSIGSRSRGISRVSTVVVESKRGKISKTRKATDSNKEYQYEPIQKEQIDISLQRYNWSSCVSKIIKYI